MDFPKSVSGVGLVNGKFVDEDEQTGQQGSLIPAAWGNMVTDEILSVQQAAGLEASEADSAQLSKALDILYLGGAQCRLGGTTQTLKLTRVKRGAMLIPGVGLVKVPAGGVSLDAAGLTPSTLYYIYAYMDGANLALEASKTARATDALTGLEIKAGDRSRLFVGIEWAASATAWGGLVRSWFNDLGFMATTLLPSNTSTSSSTPVPINSGSNRAFLTFAGESAYVEISGSSSSSGAGYSTYTWIGIDAVVAHPNSSGAHYQSAVAGMTAPFSTGATVSGLVEGYHFAAIIGMADGGYSATWGGASANGRTAVRVVIPGVNR
ncbi:hypothetical protein [Herbaspirillum huttiense]|uniref:hypothetical protein n=1 Tax=Herbaspirillum huttiense TaxID=863372 RepID=UPI0031D5A084